MRVGACKFYPPLLQICQVAGDTAALGSRKNRRLAEEERASDDHLGPTALPVRCEVATTVDDFEYIYAVDFNQIEDAVVLEKDFPEAASPGFGSSGP